MSIFVGGRVNIVRWIWFVPLRLLREIVWNQWCVWQPAHGLIPLLFLKDTRWINPFFRIIGDGGSCLSYIQCLFFNVHYRTNYKGDLFGWTERVRPALEMQTSITDWVIVFDSLIEWAIKVNNWSANVAWLNADALHIHHCLTGRLSVGVTPLDISLSKLFVQKVCITSSGRAFIGSVSNV